MRDDQLNTTTDASWGHFRPSRRGQCRLSLRPAPRSQGRQFERLCRWFLLNAPEYKAKLSNDWLWKGWSGAWAADAGIDLVAEDHHGGLWAIQAKAYDEAYAIKKADVESFLAEP